LLTVSLLSTTGCTNDASTPSDSTRATAADTSSADSGTVLIADKTDDLLYFVDRATRSVEDSIAVGRGPHEVAVHPFDPVAYVANYEGEGSISIIDLETRTERERVMLEPGSRPHGIQVDAAGTAVYVTAEGLQAVLELDPQTGAVKRTMSTSQEGTHMLALGSAHIYTANIGSGTATALNREAGNVDVHIATGEGAEGIALTSDEGEVWVSNRADDTVSIIDPETLAVVDSFRVEGFPLRIYMTPNGDTALLACAQANEVALVDVATRAVIARLPTGDTPVGIQITPDGTEAFVGNMNGGSVTVMDLEAQTVVDTLPLGTGPDGMAFVE
jgi:YVTN family beta-propeller protein